jgi:hypothetical protein
MLVETDDFLESLFSINSVLGFACGVHHGRSDKTATNQEGNP